MVMKESEPIWNGFRRYIHVLYKICLSLDIAQILKFVFILIGYKLQVEVMRCHFMAI